MKALRACLVGLLFGLFLGGAIYVISRFLYPAFLAAPADAAILITSCAGLVGAIALVLGLFFGRRGAGIACGVAAGVVAAGFAALLAPTPSTTVIGVAGVVGGSLLGIACARPRFERKAGRWLLLAAALVCIAGGVAAPAPPTAPPPDPARPKIFVFGLDAGTWTILNELFQRNELPNLRRLRDDGTSGVLLSEVASLSPRVWTTLATGKLPQKHGVLDFSCCQNEHLKTKRLWEILQSPEGGRWSVGLFQWLITWPPDPFEPFIVPAWMARGPQTQPPELSFIKEMEIAFQKGDVDRWLKDPLQRQKAITSLRDWTRGYLAHGLRFSTALKCLSALSDASTLASALAASRNDPPAVAAQTRGALDYAARRTVQLWMNGDVYLDLYRRHQPDFSCMILYGTDNLAHKFWQYHFPDDFTLPRERSEPFSNLLTDYYRAADALLGEILPLLPAATTIAVVSDHGFSSHGAGGAAMQRELRPSVSHLVTMAGVPDEVSTAEVATHGFILPKSGDVEAAKRAFDKVIAFIEGCVTADGKKVFVTKVLASAQLQVDVNPVVDLEPASRITTPAGEVAFHEIAAIEERTGNHSIEGILILKGPNVLRGHRIEGARLQDLTPTLLYLHGKPIGSDMDGEVLYDAIQPTLIENGRAERIESWDPLVPIQRDKSIVGDESAWKAYAINLGYLAGDTEKPDKDKKQESPKNGDNGAEKKGSSK